MGRLASDPVQLQFGTHFNFQLEPGLCFLHLPEALPRAGLCLVQQFDFANVVRSRSFSHSILSSMLLHLPRELLTAGLRLVQQFDFAMWFDC